MNIDNLEEKLEGKVPITRNELIELVNSWGRTDSYDYSNICECTPKECYNLSNLDVSKITNMSDIFMYSPYNGDISKWDISNAINLSYMFYSSKFNGNINTWNTSNVKNFDWIFGYSKFNGDISNWEFSKNITDCTFFFTQNENFKNKYNNGIQIPNDKKTFLEWFENNRKTIRNLNVSNEELIDIDDYLTSFDEKELKND